MHTLWAHRYFCLEFLSYPTALWCYFLFCLALRGDIRFRAIFAVEGLLAFEGPSFYYSYQRLSFTAHLLLISNALAKILDYFQYFKVLFFYSTTAYLFKLPFCISPLISDNLLYTPQLIELFHDQLLIIPYYLRKGQINELHSWLSELFWIFGMWFVEEGVYFYFLYPNRALVHYDEEEIDTMILTQEFSYDYCDKEKDQPRLDFFLWFIFEEYFFYHMEHFDLAENYSPDPLELLQRLQGQYTWKEKEQVFILLTSWAQPCIVWWLLQYT